MTNHVFFHFGFSLIMMHEMDAIRCKEWRIFPGMSFLNDNMGFKVFMFAHVPLYYYIFSSLDGDNNESLIYGFSVFLIIHLCLHFLFLMHKKNELKDWISWTIIGGAEVCGLLEIVLILKYLSAFSIVFATFMKAFLLFCTFLLFTSVAYSQQMDSIRYDKGYLFYHQYGMGEPVILLSGGPGSSYQQLEEVALELGKSYRSILLEQRGTGRSIPTPHDATTINLQAAHDDLTRLLNHLKLKEATIIGHSWGGMLAMSYATAYPAKVKSLVLLDPGPFKLDPAFNKAFMENQESRLGLQEVALRDSLSAKIKSGRATEEEKEQFEKVRLLSIVYYKTKIDSLHARIKKGGNNLKTSGLIFKSLAESSFDLTKTLPSYTKPVHIISGRQDPGAFVSYEIKVLIPAAQLYWIESAGHFPMFEQPGQFYTTILGILSKKY